MTWGGFILSYFLKFYFYPPIFSCQHFSYLSLFIQLSFTFLTFKRPPAVSPEKSPDERPRGIYNKIFPLFSSLILHLPTTYDFFMYLDIYIYIYMYKYIYIYMFYSALLSFI